MPAETHQMTSSMVGCERLNCPFGWSERIRSGFSGAAALSQLSFCFFDKSRLSHRHRGCGDGRSAKDSKEPSENARWRPKRSLLKTAQEFGLKFQINMAGTISCYYSVCVNLRRRSFNNSPVVHIGRQWPEPLAAHERPTERERTLSFLESL